MQQQSTLSDEELAERTRAGDSDAFAELWQRHANAGLAAARHFRSIADPDDIVSEAYLQLLRAFQRGGGPREAFRPYLYRTIRNVALNWRQRSTAVSIDELAELPDSGLDPEASTIQKTITVRAFRTLPERWQTVLWYTEVEGMEPAEAAPYLGLTANSAAALAYRAREGFKKAWLQAHVNDLRVAPECRWTTERMGDYAQGGLTPRARARFEEHLRTCTRCPILLEEIDELGGKLAVILLPLMLGGTAGAALLAERLGQSTPAQSPTAAAGRAGLRTGVAAVVTVAVLAVGAAAIAIPIVSQPQTSNETVAEPPAESPADEPEDRPTAPPTVSTTPPPPPVAPPAVPPPPPRPAPIIPPVVPPPVLPVDTIALPPLLHALPPDAELYLPVLSGTAEPGAAIELLDGSTVVASTFADSAGGWSVPLPDPRADGHAFVARQTDAAGNVSDPSTPTDPLTFQRPSVVSPAEGVTVPSTGGATSVTVELAGIEGMRVQIFVDGVSTGNIHTLLDVPITRVTTPLVDGVHTLGVRYFDPDTGRAGSLSIRTISIVP